MDPATFAAVADTMCLAESHSAERRSGKLGFGFLCTRAPNHDGDHWAVDGETGEVFHVWAPEAGTA